MEPSRSINHETEATSSSAINCNNASIIQNPGIRYDIRKPQSSSTASVPLHSSSSLRTDNNNGYGSRVGAGGGGGGGSSANMKQNIADRSSFHSLHYDTAQDIIMANRNMHTMNLNRATSRQMRPRRGMHDGSDSYSSKSTASSYGSSCSASSCDGSETSSTSGEPNLGTAITGIHLGQMCLVHVSESISTHILLFLHFPKRTPVFPNYRWTT